MRKDGEMYLGEASDFGKAFARKIMKVQCPEDREDIMREAEVLKTLVHGSRHDNLIRVFNHGWLPKCDFYFIDMELADISLSDYNDYIFRNQEPPPFYFTVDEIFDPVFSGRNAAPLQRLHTTCTIGAQIAGGLDFMHANGLVHRDLKPSNGTHTL
jgi:serine/threonine protein kinase